MTFHMHNKYDELGNKHVNDIFYVICLNLLINKYNIYSLQTFESHHRYKIIEIKGTIPTLLFQFGCLGLLLVGV
jgi:hypothetical protein